MSEKKKIYIGIGLIIIIILIAFLIENMVKSQGLNNAKVIKITENNKVTAYIDKDIILKLSEKNNLSLDLVLNSTGNSEFKEVEVIGQDLKSILIDKDKVKDNLNLIVDKNNNVNLYDKSDDTSLLIKKVVEIKIKN